MATHYAARSNRQLLIYLEAFFLFLLAWLAIWWALGDLNLFAPVGVLVVSALWFYVRLPTLPETSALVLTMIAGVLGLTVGELGNAMYYWRFRETHPKGPHTMRQLYRLVILASIGLGSLAIVGGAGVAWLLR